MTDEQGRFAYTSLPAGRYTLSASKLGHVNVSYGQRQPGRPGTPIQLSDGQKFEARLVLPRGGVLTGTVLDEHGEPTPGTQVRVMRYVMQNGARTLQGASTDSTDDRGVFRVYGLQPGEYAICATPRAASPAAGADMVQREVEALRQRAAALSGTDAAQAQQMLQRAMAMQAEVPDASEQQSGYAPVCYPGTTAVANAATVTLGVGEEKSGIDFPLQLVPIGSVEGLVVNSAGPAPSNLQVRLIPTGASIPGVGTLTARPGADGRFRIGNVAPGLYTLVARATAGPARPVAIAADQPSPPRVEPARLWAAADVSVDGRDVANVVLSLQPGMTVSGHIAFDGSQAPPSDLTRMRVSLAPSDTGAAREMASGAAGRVEASGRFTIPNVVPGRYRLTASGGGAGWVTESATVAGQDTLDFPVEVKPNQHVSGAVITLTDRQTELSGLLSDGRGQPATDYTLIVFPADQRFWVAGTRRIQTARPATDGRFILRNLPAGDYRIATVVDPEPGSWTDPAYLQQLEAVSLRVTLAPGEKKVQNVRLAGQ